jgi:hypothetical protein
VADAERLLRAFHEATCGSDLKIKAKVAGDGPTECTPSRRCWTIEYPDHDFHLDVLPALPDREHDGLTSILLTDVNLVRRQHSNPIGYAR